MLDYESLLYAPIYDRLGVPATITTSGGVSIPLTALNQTVPSTINTIGVDFQAFRPGAKVRMSEIPDDLILGDELPGGEMAMDGKSWSIKSYEYVASPNGNSDGEVRLILKDDLDV